jgi:hypothetical protein
LRVNAGPGLALDAARRSDGIVRAGAWLGADRVIAVSRAREGEAQFLLGSMYDVRRGALSREGSVRMVAGSVPSVNLAALASFLLTGQSSRDVKDRTAEARATRASAAAQRRKDQPPPTPAPAAGEASTAEAPAREKTIAAAPEPRVATAPRAPQPPSLAPALAPTPVPSSPDLGGAPNELLGAAPQGGSRGAGSRRPWLRGGAFASGALAVGFTALSVQQALAAKSAYDEARSMEATATSLNGDPARYWALHDRGDAASRNAYLSAGTAAAFAVAAGVLGWVSRERSTEPGLAFRF